MTLSPEDAEDLRQGVRESAKTTISNHLAVIDQWVAERAAEASMPVGFVAEPLACGICDILFSPYEGMRKPATSGGLYWCKQCQDKFDEIDWDAVNDTY